MTELWIKQKRVDMDSSTVIQQNINAGSLGDIKGQKISYTNRFKIPKTSANVVLLEGLGDFPGDTSNAQNEKLDARLIVDGIELMPDAWARVLASDDKYYELALYDKTIDFRDAIKDKKITDLSFGENHATITEASDFVRTFGNRDGYIYALGNFREGTTLLSDKSGSAANNSVETRNQLPSFYVHTLWDKILTEAGFEYEGDVFGSSEFKEEVIAPNQIRWEEEAPSSEKTTVNKIACADINHDPNSNYLSFFKSIKGDCPSSDELYLPGGNDSEYIRVYYDGGLKINMSFNVKAKQKKLDDLEEVRFYIVKFDNYEKAERVHVVDIWNNKNATWNYRAEIDDFHVEADKSLKKQGKDLEVEFPVKNGEVIRVSFLGVIKKGDLFEDYTITGSASFYKLTTAGEKQGGIRFIEFENMLPDVSQEEFINDILHRYGLFYRLVSKIGETPKLEFKHFEDVFADRSPEDWSDKFVRVERLEYSLADKDYKQNNYMKYDYADDYKDNRRIFENLKSEKNVEHEFDGNLKCANQTLNIANDLFSSPYTVHGFRVYRSVNGNFDSEISQIDLDKSRQLSAVNTPVWNVPIYDDKGEKIQDTDPQIFRINTIGVAATFHFTTGDSGLRHSPIPFLSRYRMGYQYFIDKYWNRLKQILDRQRRLIVMCKLDAIDIQNLDFFKLKYIKQSSRIYYLNKVINFTGQGLTKCELIEMPIFNEDIERTRQLKLAFRKFAGSPYPKVEHTGYNTSGYDTNRMIWKVVDGFDNPVQGERLEVTSNKVSANVQIVTNSNGEAYYSDYWATEGTWRYTARIIRNGATQSVDAYFRRALRRPTVRAAADGTHREEASDSREYRSLTATVTQGDHAIRSYHWECINKPTNADWPTIINQYSKDAGYYFYPLQKNSGAYTFRITVCDTFGLCSSDTRKETLDIYVNNPTVKIAGGDRQYIYPADGGLAVFPLHGMGTQGSFPIAHWRWRIVSGPQGYKDVLIFGGTSQDASFRCIKTLENSGTYTIELRVCDKYYNCGRDTVRLTFTFTETEIQQQLRGEREARQAWEACTVSDKCYCLMDFSYIEESRRTPYQRGYQEFYDVHCIGLVPPSVETELESISTKIGDIGCPECDKAKKELDEKQKQFEAEVDKDPTSEEVIKKAEAVRDARLKWWEVTAKHLKSQQKEKKQTKSAGKEAKPAKGTKSKNKKDGKQD